MDSFNDQILFELALFIGSVHIILSLLRYVGRNWSAVGWILFIIGGYLYFPYMLKTASLLNYAFGVPGTEGAAWGLNLVYGGIGLATALALVQKKWGGLAEPMVVIQVFGDILSYLRLYALGLAGAIVAATINSMAAEAGLFFGFFILLLGHTVNIGLGIMSGVIHGLRLNFLEWYHYSFEGGGKLFTPLRLLQREQ